MKVLVLMSSWNGAAYIETQIASIAAQVVDGDIHILVRDDGSQDNTIEILKKYDPELVTVIPGNNLGVKASFFELMRIALDYRADFYALADQDDYWLPEKLAKAISSIDSKAPALYCSALTLVDQKLDFLSIYRHPGSKSFASTLLCNFATGCTCVMTRPLLEQVRPPADFSQIIMHDWWLASSAAALGSVSYDANSYIYYRQHQTNQVGIARGFRGFLKRCRKFLSANSSPSRLTQATEFHLRYADLLSDSDRGILQYFLQSSNSVLGRLTFAWKFRSEADILRIARYILRA